MKMYKALLIACILTYAGFLSANGRFFPGKSSHPVESVYGFIGCVLDSRFEYHTKYKKNPLVWSDLWPVMKSQVKGSTALDDEKIKREGTLLTTVFTVDKKDVSYAFIMKHEGVWKVYTENSSGADNWIVRADLETPYLYFADEANEKSAIAEKIKQLKGKKVLGFDINMKRTGILGGWLFYHKEGFYSLFPFLEDTSEYCYFKTEVVKAMKRMPDLHRYKDSFTRIDALIKAEKKLSIRDDKYRDTYIELLFELKKAIYGVKQP